MNGYEGERSFLVLPNAYPTFDAAYEALKGIKKECEESKYIKRSCLGETTYYCVIFEDYDYQIEELEMELTK